MSLLLAGALLVTVAPTLLVEEPLWGVLLLIALMTVVAAVSRRPAARARAVARDHDECVRP